MRRVLTSDYSGKKCLASALRGESDVLRGRSTLTITNPRTCSGLGIRLCGAGIGAEVSSRPTATPGTVSAELSV